MKQYVLPLLICLVFSTTAAGQPPANSELAPTSSASETGFEDSVPSDSQTPMPRHATSGVWNTLNQLLVISLPHRSWPRFAEFVLVLVCLLFMLSLVHRTRDQLAETGLLPRLLQVSQTLLTTLAIVGTFLLITMLVPRQLHPLLRWTFIALALALGWTTRDFLPDLFAGVILLLERKVRPGVWIQGKGFSGTVERKTVRAVWLRDARDHRIMVPNRHLLSAPLVSDRGLGVEHEVSLRIAPTTHTETITAATIRHAIADAVRMSPWVPANAAPNITRDTQDPDQWHVRSRLLNIRLASRFEGDLLERIEEILN